MFTSACILCIHSQYLLLHAFSIFNSLYILCSNVYSEEIHSLQSGYCYVLKVEAVYRATSKHVCYRFGVIFEM